MLESVFVEDVMPTAEERAFYDNNGWLLTKLVIRDEWLEEFRRAADEIYAGHYDGAAEWCGCGVTTAFGDAKDEGSIRYDSYVSHHKNAFTAGLRTRHLGRYAAALIDAEEVRLFRDVLLTAPPGERNYTGLHIDKNYWPTCSSERLLSAWFSFDDCEAQNGCLAVISGSHLWRRTTFVRKIALDDAATLAKVFGARGESAVPEPVPHRRGQVSFHAARLLHGTMPNRSGRTRQSVAVALQDGENRYRPLGPGGSARYAAFATNDRIGPKSQDGTPQYGDDAFYPCLYRTEG